jgi:hypothetical protein
MLGMSGVLPLVMLPICLRLALCVLRLRGWSPSVALTHNVDHHTAAVRTGLVSVHGGFWQCLDPLTHGACAGSTGRRSDGRNNPLSWARSAEAVGGVLPTPFTFTGETHRRTCDGGGAATSAAGCRRSGRSGAVGMVRAVTSPPSRLLPSVETVLARAVSVRSDGRLVHNR